MPRTKNSTVSKVKGKDKTIIKFIWGDNPAGFSMEGYSNFWPSMKTELRQFPNMTGNFPVIVFDKDEIVTIELPAEYPRELPKYINENENAEVRERYRTEMAKIAAGNHMKNNHVRDELSYHEQNGRIKVIYDSFFDEESKNPDIKPKE